jgi:hypothetical protein
MNGSEEEFAGKIRAYLDRSATEMKPGLAYRLREMRNLALDRLEGTQAQQAWVPSVAHGLAGTMPAPAAHNARRATFALGTVVVLLAVSTFGYQQWNAYKRINDFAELDAQILTSDLPIDAYLDGGFQAWLKTSADD